MKTDSVHSDILEEHIRREALAVRSSPLPFAFIILLLVGGNLLWFSFGTHPFHWDSAIHFTESLKADRIGGDSSQSFIKQALNISWYYPPLVSYCSVPLFRIFGETDFSAFLLMLFFLLLFIISIRSIALTLTDSDTVGFLSMLMALASPVVLEYSRTFMLDLPLASMIAVTIALLLRSDRFSRLPETLLFGIACGLGMLSKWTFIAFTFGPIVFELLSGLRKRKHVLRNFLFAAFAGIIIALPWYGMHFLQILTTRTGFLTDETRSPIQTIFYFLSAVPLQCGIPLTLVVAAGILLSIRQKTYDKIFLLVWFLSSYIINSFIAFKQPRHSIALLPPLFILASMGMIGWMKERRHPRISIVLVAMFVSIQYVLVSFVPQDSRPGHLLSSSVAGYPILSVQGATQQDWKQLEIVSAIENDIALKHLRKAVVRMIPDAMYFNNASLTAQAVARRTPCVVLGTTGFPNFTDYLVVKTGSVGIDSPDSIRMDITRSVLRESRDAKGLYRRIGVWKLPDSSDAVLLRVESSPLQHKVSTRSILASARLYAEDFIQKYFHAGKNYSLVIDTISSKETLRGHVRDIRIRADEASFGDFTFNPVGVAVHNIDLSLNDVTLDPARLLKDNVLILLNVGGLSIDRFRIDENDIREYIQHTSGDHLTVDSLSMMDGILHMSGTASKKSFSIDLSLKTTGTNIVFEVKSCRLMGFPIPAWVVNAVTSAYNPVITGLDVVEEVKIQPLRLEEHRLEIHEP